MSHFTDIETRVRDIAAVRAACAELGLQVLENAEARGYAQNKVRGDFVIQLNGPYDVALQRDDNGNYRFVADLWQGHVEKELGQGFGRLKQLYGVHKATIEARRKGLSVRRRKLPNGSIRLALCRL